MTDDPMTDEAMLRAVSRAWSDQRNADRCPVCGTPGRVVGGDEANDSLAFAPDGTLIEAAEDVVLQEGRHRLGPGFATVPKAALDRLRAVLQEATND